MLSPPLASLVDRPFMAVGDLIRLHAAERPRHPAVVAGDELLRWEEFDARLDRVAAALARDGVAKGGVLALCAEMSIDYLSLFFGALRAGVAVAPLSPSLSDAALMTMIADADAVLLFTDSRAAASPAGVAVVDIPLGGWLGDGPSALRPVSIDRDDACNLIYSSGTTGTPKGVVQPHGMRWAHIQRGARQGYDGAAVTLVATPLYSNTTLVSVYPTVGVGGTLVLMPKFDAAGFLQLSERHGVTHAMLVPVQYQRIMALADFDRHDLSAYKMKFCTSAPFSAALKADVLARWPGGLTEYYGMTEGGGTCILRAHDYPDKLDSVGRPAPGSDIRLIDEEGVEVAPGEPGEVVGRSPAMMTGYHKRPEETARAEWRDPEGRRFIRTGDIGRFDPDGFLRLIDRKKDMIISGGFNLYPSDLEAVIATHPEVAEAAVVGIASAQWGETPVAFVVPREGAEPDAEALRNWANARLERLQRLAEVRLLRQLPRSPIGKVLKRELRDIYSTPGANLGSRDHQGPDP